MIKRHWLFLLPIAWVLLGTGFYMDDRFREYLKWWCWATGCSLIVTTVFRNLYLIDHK